LTRLAARASGIGLTLPAAGSIRARGLAAAVARWKSVLAANKPAVIAELSRQALVNVAALEERVAVHLEYRAGLPRSWAEPFARLLCSHPPGDFDPV
jgi:hypothetical protein